MLLALCRRVKGENSEDACHLIHIAASTKSGIHPRLWIGRTLEAYHRKGITSGWMSQNEDDHPSCVSAYESYLFSILQDIQARDVIPERLLALEDDVSARFGLS
jgi:hypothetical protein